MEFVKGVKRKSVFGYVSFRRKKELLIRLKTRNLDPGVALSVPGGVYPKKPSHSALGPNFRLTLSLNSAALSLWAAHPAFLIPESFLRLIPAIIP